MATTNAATKMSTVEERKELDARARSGQIVVPGGKGGKSLLAQEKLAEGRMKGGKTRREQLGINGYKMMGKKGGQTRKEQLGTEGYRKLGRLGGLSNFATRNEPKSGLAIKSEPTSTSASPEPMHGSTSASTSLDLASTPALPSNYRANEN